MTIFKVVVLVRLASLETSIHTYAMPKQSKDEAGKRKPTQKHERRLALKALRDARSYAKVKDYCHRPPIIEFPLTTSDQQERQSEIDGDPKRHLIIKDGSKGGTLLQKIPPPTAEFRIPL